MSGLRAILGAGLLAVTCMGTGVAQAQDKLEFSANMAITSDYVFRGFTQSNEGPAGQAGVDVTYNMFYAGIWGSSVDFGDDLANVEVDFYAGIKPKLGNVEFDLGVIYYAYPKAKDAGGEYNLVEFKAGASTSFDKLSVGATVYYSPEFFAETGKTWTIEGTAEYSLPMGFAVSGTVGTMKFDEDSTADYVYWNAGLSKSFGDHWTIDARYWDTDYEAGGNLSDERFVGTVSFSF